MEEKSFVWTSDITRRFFELRFENEWLFQKLKQPWGEFYKVLQENGFPEEMTIQHVRKKWSYTYDAYRAAKRTKNKDWKYYKMFDKHYGKAKILDKYESWNDEWRLKLILCLSEAKEMKFDFNTLWRVTERALRCQDLPIDCCIQDIKGLWHHIKMTFNRKHRLKLRRGEDSSDWPLYDPVMEFFKRHDKEYLDRLDDESNMEFIGLGSKTVCNRNRNVAMDSKDANDFQWTKDITESFIQVRLQHDWLFRQRNLAWIELRNIMIEEYGFPKSLTSRDLSKKWANTFADYQKAQASGNRSWVYYRLFELHLGDGTLSLNPLRAWQEQWVLQLISARADLDHLFHDAAKERYSAWREVEKKLRAAGVPVDHSLLDLHDIWVHLMKTYRWKRKFAKKGILNEQWPYYEAMSKYMDSRVVPVKRQKADSDCDGDGADDDDMKLLDLKEKWALGPKRESAQEGGACRACAGAGACVDVFAHRDDDGVALADKLRAIGGVEVDRSDSLPTHICLSCFAELDAAYRFRRRCQDLDRGLREARVKVELPADHAADHDHHDHDDHDHDDPYDHIAKTERPIKTERTRKKKRKLRYEYWKICEVCGKHTKNLISHLDTHASDKVYSCEVCEKRFKFKSGLIVHRAVHDPTPKKTCEVCGKTFHILAQYRRHFVYHANERKYACDTCGKRFNTVDILRVHNRMHTDERPFSCAECGKTFRTAGCVSRHKRIVHRHVKL